MNKNAKSKKFSWQKYVSIIAFIIMGGVLGYSVGRYAVELGKAAPFIGLILLAMMFAAFIVHIVIHQH